MDIKVYYRIRELVTATLQFPPLCRKSPILFQLFCDSHAMYQISLSQIVSINKLQGNILIFE